MNFFWISAPSILLFSSCIFLLGRAYFVHRVDEVESLFELEAHEMVFQDLLVEPGEMLPGEPKLLVEREVLDGFVDAGHGHAVDLEGLDVLLNPGLFFEQVICVLPNVLNFETNGIHVLVLHEFSLGDDINEEGDSLLVGLHDSVHFLLEPLNQDREFQRQFLHSFLQLQVLC